MSNSKNNSNVTLKHYVSGAISGITGLLLSHPFDTIKNNIQNKSSIGLSPKKLYRGILPPMLGIGFEKAIVFGTYNFIFCKFKEKNNLAIGTAGAISGLAASWIVTPYERIKIILQTNKRSIILDRSQGLSTQLFHPRKLFTGLTATFTRETPGFALYFLTYENLKSYFFPNNNITKTSSFLFGGIAGATAWCFIYPQDLIKTRMQANISENKLTFTSVAKQVYKEAGPRAFYKGFHFALMRAVPLHAGTFAMMEVMKTHYICC